MHLGVVHRRLEARGRPFVRSPRSRSRVNLRVLRPLTRGPQGQPSPLRTLHSRPGVQGIFPTSRGQAPHGWPMVHHSMATGFPIPRGCCLALSASHPIPCSPLPHPVTGPLPVSCGFPIPRGCCAAPFHPSSRVYTPLGRQQPCGAGPLDPHPSGDRFVRLALVAPFSFPPLPPAPCPVTHLGLFPASCVFPVSLGPSCDPSHTPFSAPFPYPSIPCFYHTELPATLWRGPTGSASCLGPARATSTVRSLPVPFRLGGVLSSGPVVVPSSGPRSLRYSYLSPTWSPDVVVFAFFFSLATRGLSSAHLLHPVPPPPARSALLALLCRCGVSFMFCFCPPPFPAVPPAFWFPPPCMHAQQPGTGHLSLLPSVLLSCPIALLGRGPWRSPAMPGGRPWTMGESPRRGTWGGRPSRPTGRRTGRRP